MCSQSFITDCLRLSNPVQSAQDAHDDDRVHHQHDCPGNSNFRDSWESEILRIVLIFFMIRAHDDPFKAMVSNRRLRGFLLSEEIDDSKIKRDENANGERVPLLFSEQFRTVM